MGVQGVLVPTGHQDPLNPNGRWSYCDRKPPTVGVPKGGPGGPPLELNYITFSPPMPVGYPPTHGKCMGGGRGWASSNPRQASQRVGPMGFTHPPGEAAAPREPPGGLWAGKALLFPAGCAIIPAIMVLLSGARPISGRGPAAGRSPARRETGRERSFFHAYH